MTCLRRLPEWCRCHRPRRKHPHRRRRPGSHRHRHLSGYHRRHCPLVWLWSSCLWRRAHHRLRRRRLAQHSQAPFRRRDLHRFQQRAYRCRRRLRYDRGCHRYAERHSRRSRPRRPTHRLMPALRAVHQLPPAVSLQTSAQVFRSARSLSPGPRATARFLQALRGQSPPPQGSLLLAPALGLMPEPQALPLVFRWPTRSPVLVPQRLLAQLRPPLWASCRQLVLMARQSPRQLAVALPTRALEPAPRQRVLVCPALPVRHRPPNPQISARRRRRVHRSGPALPALQELPDRRSLQQCRGRTVSALHPLQGRL